MTDTDLAAFNAPHLTRFTILLREAMASGRLLRLVLVGYQGGVSEADVAGQPLQRVIVRAVALRDEPHLSFVWRYPTKDITRNLPASAGVDAILSWLQAGAFRNAHMHTPTEEVQLAFSKKGKASVRVGKAAPGDAAAAGEGEAQAAQAGQAAHNRDKHRHLEVSRPFLRELGVTDAQGHLIPAMSRKWKQINKFIEVFSAALGRSRLADKPAVHVADFGSGKGYLTFAVHDWLTDRKSVV